MMPYVTAMLMVTQCFFLILNAFVASPFQMLAVGQGDHRGAGRQRAEPAAAVLADGDPSADAVPRLRRLRRCRSPSPSAR